MTKLEILHTTAVEFEKVNQICLTFNDVVFFENPPHNKWNIADNVKHLLISTNISTMAFWLPKWVIRWIGGTPNRPSKSYAELVHKYELKLAEGAVAGGRFVPKPTKDLTSKKKLLIQWAKVTKGYLTLLQKNRTEDDLDNYLIKHPLLGKITMRELCYFNIYHTQYHLKAINIIISSKK